MEATGCPTSAAKSWSSDRNINGASVCPKERKENPSSVQRKMAMQNATLLHSSSNVFGLKAKMVIMVLLTMANSQSGERESRKKMPMGVYDNMVGILKSCVACKLMGFRAYFLR
ncbi:hypothetical protein SAY87_017343 [Trapa incisa]|uniref:Uncharacterized protein n=1 Tax=Trapa incisa TaxID=236973 RepID=A0AAN7LJJ2_9MYRT|nr:hypothetical protein SAY87_017343 [Trapa incisa]